MEVARAINPNLRILVHTTYLRVAENLKSEGVSAVFSGEREVAVAHDRTSDARLRSHGRTNRPRTPQTPRTHGLIILNVPYMHKPVKAT